MRISRRIVLALTLVIAMAASAGAQVLDQVPAGAWVVVKVKNLTETNTKLSAFFKDLGVDQVVPEMADPLGSLKKELKIEKGIDDKGEFAFVFVNPDLAGGDDDQAIVMLIPVSDYKEFTANWPEAKTEGELTEVQLPKDDQPSYVASWGKFAAISPSKELLGKKPAGGVKLAGLTARELANKDAIVYVNLVAIREKAVPELKKLQTEANDNMQRDLPENAKKYAPVLKAAVGQLLGAVERYLLDADSATYGLSFGATGINGTLMTEFKPESYLGEKTKQLKNVPDSLLVGLPTAKYLAYGGSVASPEVTTKVWDDFIGPINKEITGLGDDGKLLKSYIDGVRKAIVASQAGTFGMIAPNANLGQESVIQLVQTMSGDAKALGEAQKSMMENQQELMKLMQGEGMSPKVTFTPGAKTLEGVALDEIVTKFEGEPNDPQAAQMQQMMQMMYGAGGANVLTGQIDDKTRITATGVNDETITALIKSAKGKEDSVAKAEGVAAVAGQLPKEKFAVTYIAVDNILTTAMKYAAAFGAQMPLNLPPNQPPVGVSIASEGSAIRVDTFVPTQLVKSVTAAIIQLQMQMQGGGVGGGM
jgi:hypothetical protein